MTDYFQKVRRLRVLVVGDLCADVYVFGDTERVSREAPVPVVLERSREIRMGGAGNVAQNVAALGAKVQLLAFAFQQLPFHSPCRESLLNGKVLPSIARHLSCLPCWQVWEWRRSSTKIRASSG